MSASATSERPGPIAVAPRPAAAKTAERSRHRLRPRLQLGRGHARPCTTPRSIAARRRPETSTSRATIARDHPGRPDPVLDQHHQHGEHEHLVGDRVEQRAERRGRAAAAARSGRPASPSPSRRRRATVAHAFVVGEAPRRRAGRRREPRPPGRRSADRGASSAVRIRGRMPHVLESPGRKSRRDRDPRSSGALRELGIGSGRRLLRGRPRRAPRALRRRGLPDRPRAGSRELSRRRADCSKRRSGPERRRSILATASLPRTRLSRALRRGCRRSSGSGLRASAIELMGSKTEARTAMRAARACRSSRGQPTRSRRRGGDRRARGRARLPAASKGGRGRRRQGDEGGRVGGRGRGGRSRRRSARAAAYFADAA